LKVVDSSGWLEFFADGPLAESYAAHLADLAQVLTPVIVLYEVYRWLKRERGDEEAIIAAAQIAKTQVVPVTVTLALTAADLGLEHGLPMADSLVYATAVSMGAELITSDGDFASLPGVTYLAKPKPDPPTPG
jgi:predicted nucleic acid-binding protein